MIRPFKNKVNSKQKLLDLHNQPEEMNQFL